VFRNVDTKFIRRGVTQKTKLYIVIIYLLVYEDGTVFRNVGIQNSKARELPKKYIEHTEQGKSLKSTMTQCILITYIIVLLLHVWVLHSSS
jgi:hypothetical protein